MLVIIEYAHCMCKIEAVSIINFECDGIYGIEWRIVNLKLSYELELGGIYGMTYARYIHTYIHTYIDRGDAVWQVWGSLRLAPIIYKMVASCKCDLYFNCLYVTCFLHTNSIHASANARSTENVMVMLILVFRIISAIELYSLIRTLQHNLQTKGVQITVDTLLPCTLKRNECKQ